MTGKIVLYRLKPEACGNVLSTNQVWAAEVFDKLKTIIPQITRLESGINNNRLDWSSDFSLLVEFTSWEAIDIFDHHRAVKEAFEFMDKIICEQRLVEFFA